MFGSLGGPELLLILVLALLLFGPRRLPEIGRTIGRGMSEFRKATSEFKTSLEREVDLKEVKDVRTSIQEAHQDVSRTISEARKLAVAREEGSTTSSRRGDEQAPPAAPEPGDASTTPSQPDGTDRDRARDS
jgi:TatA/E family protein of Tat protein translocase